MYGFDQGVIGGCLRFLDTRYVIAGGVDAVIQGRAPQHLAAVVAGQPHGQQPLLLCLLQRRQHVC